jgi:hypothetical protein
MPEDQLAAGTDPALSVAALTATFLGIAQLLGTLCAADVEFGKSGHHSLGVIKRALDLFTPLGIAISFNGGKDACAVLFLLMIALAERGQLHLLCGPDTGAGKMAVIYFEKEEFPAVEQFTDKVIMTSHSCAKYLPSFMHYSSTLQLLRTHPVIFTQ